MSPSPSRWSSGPRALRENLPHLGTQPVPRHGRPTPNVLDKALGAITSQEYPTKHGGVDRSFDMQLVAVPAAAVVLLIMLRSVFFQPFVIPSSSMEDTLLIGDRVLVTLPDSGDIRRGDVIVFADPDHWLGDEEKTSTSTKIFEAVGLMPENSGHHLIKRVIGVGGDHVVADASGRLSVNGTVVSEPYLKDGTVSSATPFDVTVPAGMVWVMGDNRMNSADSRYHTADAHGGFVPLDDVVGVAKAVVWPNEHWKLLDGSGTQLAQLPGAKAK